MTYKINHDLKIVHEKSQTPSEVRIGRVTTNSDTKMGKERAPTFHFPYIIIMTTITITLG